jgi:hypothetical protein
MVGICIPDLVWHKFDWAKDQETAFRKLRQDHFLVPAYPSMDCKYKLQLRMDINNAGISVVMTQVQEGKERQMTFVSRQSHTTEK